MFDDNSSGKPKAAVDHWQRMLHLLQDSPGIKEPEGKKYHCQPISQTTHQWQRYLERPRVFHVLVRNTRAHVQTYSIQLPKTCNHACVPPLGGGPGPALGGAAGFSSGVGSTAPSCCCCSGGAAFSSSALRDPPERSSGFCSCSSELRSFSAAVMLEDAPRYRVWLLQICPGRDAAKSCQCRCAGSSVCALRDLATLGFAPVYIP